MLSNRAMIQNTYETPSDEECAPPFFLMTILMAVFLIAVLRSLWLDQPLKLLLLTFLKQPQGALP